jgi:hypothetical protein
VVLLKSQKRYDDMQAILLSLFGSTGATETPVQDTECAQGGGHARQSLSSAEASVKADGGGGCPASGARDRSQATQ